MPEAQNKLFGAQFLLLFLCTRPYLPTVIILTVGALCSGFLVLMHSRLAGALRYIAGMRHLI